MFEDMHWLNEPNRWTTGTESLHAITKPKTGFWRDPFYGSTLDNGHFFHKEIIGDFTATVTLAAGLKSQHDQCGLMVRSSENNWIKTGMELNDGKTHLNTVITRGTSDRSMLPVTNYQGEQTLRLTRHGNAVWVQYLHRVGMLGVWKPLRLGYLPPQRVCQVGLMCCSPEREGFKTTFTEFSISDPIPSDSMTD